jgi:RNA recognition motif-containing protein
MNIYISNVNFRTKSESLQALFEQYGEVSSANIITDRETGRSRGFGFVEMPNDEEAKKAIESLNGTDFEDKTITVNEARPKADRDDRGGYNRGGGGGYGRGNGGGGGYNRGGNGGGGYNRNRY